MFETLEEANAAYEKLEAELTESRTKVSTLERGRKELLEDLTKLKPLKELLKIYPDFSIDTYTKLQSDYQDLLTGAESKLQGALAENQKTLNARIAAFEADLKAAKEEKEAEKKLREEEKLQREAADLDRDIIAEYAKNGDIYNPNQLLSLTRSNITREDGAIVYRDSPNAVAVSLSKQIEAMRKLPEWQNQFKSMLSGGGAHPGTKKTSDGEENPFDPKTRNWTLMGQIEAKNPELAEKLRAAVKK